MDPGTDMNEKQMRTVKITEMHFLRVVTGQRIMFINIMKILEKKWGQQMSIYY
jgi:hypothetical protein